jgi:hypothetical protein
MITLRLNRLDMCWSIRWLVSSTKWRILRIVTSGTGSEVECSLRLESDQPIFSWVSQIENVTSDPGFSSSRSAGGSHLLVPSSANTGSWSSSLVVVNLGSSTASVDLVSRNNAGEVQGRLPGVLIPAQGFISYENILSSMGVANGYRPIEILAADGQPLIATSRVRSSSRTSGFFEGQLVE